MAKGVCVNYVRSAYATCPNCGCNTTWVCPPPPSVGETFGCTTCGEKLRVETETCA